MYLKKKKLFTTLLRKDGLDTVFSISRVYIMRYVNIRCLKMGDPQNYVSLLNGPNFGWFQVTPCEETSIYMLYQGETKSGTQQATPLPEWVQDSTWASAVPLQKSPIKIPVMFQLG